MTSSILNFTIIGHVVPNVSTIVNVTRAVQYDDINVIGEFVRNVCVNLGINPDTVDGVTRNVEVSKSYIYIYIDVLLYIPYIYI